MKGQKRKNQENKETQFILGERVFTLDRVQRTVKRLKNNEHDAVPEGIQLCHSLPGLTNVYRCTYPLWDHLRYSFE